ASDDEDLDNPFGEPVEVPVLDNDEGDLDAGTVRIIDPVTGNPVTKLVVPGEGTWTVDGGTIRFTPDKSFTGDPTPVIYQVADIRGETAEASVTVTYLPEARDDVSRGNPA